MSEDWEDWKKAQDAEVAAKDREDKRFAAALMAMNALIVKSPSGASALYVSDLAEQAVAYADALLNELDPK